MSNETDTDKPAAEAGKSACSALLVGNILHLHLKYEYFDAVARGEKLEEYRAAEKWRKRLDAKRYDGIRLYRAYQKVAADTVIDLPYKGYEVKTITHPHFGNVPTEVCAIDVAH